MAPSEPRNSAAQRGTKRKRPAPKQETPGEIIPKKLHHGLHEARKAAKKAAAFELRKLVKRLKQARAQDAGGRPVKGDDPAEMERQLEVLKHAEPEQFANTALKTKILKDKLLSQNDDVQAALADKLATNLVAPQEPGSAAAKVHSRLLSSKILAEAVHAVVDTLREVLDPSLAKGKTKRAEAAAESADDDDDGDEVEAEVERPSRGKKARVADESDEEDDEEGSEAEVNDAGWESGTVDGGDDAGWESGTVDGGEGAVAGSSDEDEGEDDEESAEELSDELPKAKAKAKAAPAQDAKSSKTKAAGGESTFLPSLSVGFTRGDSDASDISDDEADAPRKNRRGQRARRAIWEKKYGKNANHVKKQQEQDPRQQRRDGSRGAGGGGNAKGPGKAQAQARGAPARRGAQKFVAPQQTDSGWGKPVGAGAGAGANPKTGAPKEDKGLHPSWEAKRKLKEKLNPSIVPAQGKKIKFS